MKILYVAGREAEYSRTRIVIAALRARGHELTLCLPPDRRFRHYFSLAWQVFRKAGQCNVVLVGFYGQLLLPLVWLATRKPMIFDTYITTYDTMVFDRAKAKPGSFKAWVYGLSDRLSYRLARISILDSQHVIDHFGRLFNCSTHKLRRLFLAVDDTVLHPRTDMPAPATLPTADQPLLVHFHGEYTPFHGVSTIIQAAKILQDAAEPVVFQVVGKGITYGQDRALAAELGVTNMRFIDPVPYPDLADLMDKADICLGIFGNNHRAELVITNKVVEAIGMRKPLITRDNAPVRELLTHNETAYLVPPANPEALADAIRTLGNDPAKRDAMAQAGYARFLEYGTISQLGAGFDRILNDLQDQH